MRCSMLTERRLSSQSSAACRAMLLLMLLMPFLWAPALGQDTTAKPDERGDRKTKWKLRATLQWKSVVQPSARQFDIASLAFSPDGKKTGRWLLQRRK